LFHNANFFGSCIIHILYTGCAEIKKNNSGAKGLTSLITPGVISVANFTWGSFTSRGQTLEFCGKTKL